MSGSDRLEVARDEFVKKYMQPPYNVNSVGIAQDEQGSPVIGYSLNKSLDDGLFIEAEFMGFKTQLFGIGPVVASVKNT